MDLIRQNDVLFTFGFWLHHFALFNHQLLLCRVPTYIRFKILNPSYLPTYTYLPTDLPTYLTFKTFNPTYLPTYLPSLGTRLVMKIA